MNQVLTTIKPLSVGRRRPIIVADFDSFTTTQTLGQQLCADPQDHSIYAIDSVADLSLSSTPIPLPKLASGYAQAIVEQGISAATIVGRCSAGALSVLIAADLAENHGLDVRPVLVDPTWVGRQSVTRGIAMIRRSLGGDDRHDLVDATDPDALFKALYGEVTAHLRDQGVGLDEIELVRSMLMARYRAWLGFLHETFIAGVPAPAPHPTILASTDYRRVWPSSWKPSDATEIMFDQPASELIRHTGFLEEIFRV